MPRYHRINSRYNRYHIILRGVNQQIIFQEEYDKIAFLQMLNISKQTYPFELYSYCLMSNHIHLLLEPDPDISLESIIKSFGARFVYWYNAKYHRCGHLFQNRFYSEPVDSEKYFLTAIRYIHNNPVKAGIVQNPNDYSWSSSKQYFENSKNSIITVNLSPAISAAGCIQSLKAFLLSDGPKINHSIQNDLSDDNFSCIDIVRPPVRMDDYSAIKLIKQITHITNMHEFPQIEKTLRNNYIYQLHNNGVSIRQIARLCGISKATVERVLNNR